MQNFGTKVRKASIVGGSLAAMTAYAWAAPTPADAYASGCTGTANGIQCMTIWGSGQYVNSMQESSWSPTSPVYHVCSYNARWEGDTTAEGWVYWYGQYHAGCVTNTAWEGPYITSPRKMHSGSYFYGCFKSNETNNKYSAPVRETIG